MLMRARRLYRRYVTHHRVLRLADFPGGHVELRHGRLRITGRVGPGILKLFLDHGGAADWVCPDRDGGFDLSLPFKPGAPARLRFRGETGRTVRLPALSRWRLAVAEVALWPDLVRRLARLLPLLPRVLRQADPSARAAVKRALGLDGIAPAPELSVLPGPEGMEPIDCEIAVILPVHDGFEHLAPCLSRLRAGADLPWRLLVVEDGSTDPRVREFLRGWVAAEPRAALLCHEAPRGFAAAVNAGLARLGGFSGPVVLLNSDVTLPEGWAARLVAPLLADEAAASVTPLSNEGELMGAPLPCIGVSLRKGEVDAIDAALRPLARARALLELPTGTGFCMALSPRWLRRVPRFDERFGRGYGEEVDWCQRVRALGGRHLCQTGLFVGHVGAASFGRARRALLREKAAGMLARRYPGFEAEVQGALARDPMAAERLRAGLAWARARMAGRGQALPLYLAHSLGGGAEHWLADRLARQTGAGGAALVLRVGGHMRWQLELHAPGGVARGATGRFALVRALLGFAGPLEVIYSCAVGDPAPGDIPQRLLDLCAGGQGLEILFHDYFPLSRDYRLVEGIRSETGWAALWRPALERADHLTVFSQASRAIVAAAHPDLADRLRVIPHPPRAPLPRLAPAPLGAPRVVAVPGHLDGPKGAGVVAELGREFARTGEARIVVLGETAPEVHLPRGVRVLGGYDLADLPHLAARHGVTCWLVPSLWPETFSYVTQEVLQTGLPAFGFALGAQGEALAEAARRRGQGGVVSPRNTGALLALLRAQPGWPAISAARPRRRWRRVPA